MQKALFVNLRFLDAIAELGIHLSVGMQSESGLKLGVGKTN